MNDSSDFMTIEIANKSADLLDEIMDIINNSTTLLPSLLDADKKPSLNATAFVQDFSSCLGNLMVYAIDDLNEILWDSENITSDSSNSTNQTDKVNRRRFLDNADASGTSVDNPS